MHESEVAIKLTPRATIKSDSREAFSHAALNAIRENIIFQGKSANVREIGGALIKDGICDNWRLHIHDIEVTDVI